MSTSNAIVSMSGYVLFLENIGVAGGGLHMERKSYIIFVNETQLVFADNTALVEGPGWCTIC